MTYPVVPSGAKTPRSFSVPSRFKPGGGAALLSARDGRWRPSLADQPLHSEIFAGASDASGAGLALALACDALTVAGRGDDPLAGQEDRRQVLWVQDARAIQRSGRPYHHGMPHHLRDRLIHVEARTPEDALFALEEGLRCRDLACVIGEIVGNPRALDFTASRRLSLAAEKHGIALWLVRLEAAADLSSARMRWRVEAAPSTLPLWNVAAPGAAAWVAELFRARSHAPGKWILSNENGRLSVQESQQLPKQLPKYKRPAANTQNIGHLVHPTVGRSLAAVARA